LLAFGPIGNATSTTSAMSAKAMRYNVRRPLIVKPPVQSQAVSHPCDVIAERKGLRPDRKYWCTMPFRYRPLWSKRLFHQDMSRKQVFRRHRRRDRIYLPSSLGSLHVSPANPLARPDRVDQQVLCRPFRLEARLDLLGLAAPQLLASPNSLKARRLPTEL
jgi:hypothetical protein